MFHLIIFINVLVIVQRVMSSSLASWYRCIPEVPIIPRQPVLRIFRELKKKEEENKILRPDAIWSFLNFLSFAILAFKQASFYFFKNEILNEIWKELKKVLPIIVKTNFLLFYFKIIEYGIFLISTRIECKIKVENE